MLERLDSTSLDKILESINSNGSGNFSTKLNQIAHLFFGPEVAKLHATHTDITNVLETCATALNYCYVKVSTEDDKFTIKAFKVMAEKVIAFKNGQNSHTSGLEDAMDLMRL